MFFFALGYLLWDRRIQIHPRTVIEISINKSMSSHIILIPIMDYKYCTLMSMALGRPTFFIQGWTSISSFFCSPEKHGMVLVHQPQLLSVLSEHCAGCQGAHTSKHRHSAQNPTVESDNALWGLGFDKLWTLEDHFLWQQQRKGCLFRATCLHHFLHHFRKPWEKSDSADNHLLTGPLTVWLLLSINCANVRVPSGGWKCP